MEWQIRRGEAESWVAPNVETLKAWAGGGRVRPDDYVFHPVLKQWLYARDVAELTSMFLPAPLPHHPQVLYPARKGATIEDGVKIGCGIFIVLPLIIIGLLLALGTCSAAISQ